MNQYNWDNLEVGRYDLNHSENFFAFKHSKHEKFDLETENEAMIDEEDIKGSYNDVLREKLLQDPLNYEKDSKKNIENNFVKISEGAQQNGIEKSVHCNKEFSNDVNTKMESENILNDNKENCEGNVGKPNNFHQNISGKIEKSTEEKKLLENVEILTNKNNSPGSKISPPSNLLHQPIKTWSGIATQSKEKIPNVLKYVEIYEKKRQNVIKKKMEEDRKNRIFHSKPAPNFAMVRENSSKKLYEQKMTEPITPRVLKNSVKASEKLKRLENIKKKSPKKYHAREAKVLNESPFLPKKEPHVLQTQPFKLHIEKRLCERKYFDEKIHRQMEERKKKEEEERIKRDEELSKEFRKMTTFKARPNPFK